MSLKSKIENLHIKDSKKIRLYNGFMKPVWFLKSLGNPTSNYRINNRCFIHQNSFYGHEYWLRKYADYQEGPIYGLVEHGICFEDDIAKTGWAPEWGIGSILTFGEARHKMLSNLYPEHKIFPIGPRIHYSDIDTEYYEDLKSQIDISSKTIVLYPSHSLENDAYRYDVELFYKNAMDFAEQNGIKNVMVSLHPSDVAHGFVKQYRAISDKLVLVTGGTESRRFLPRLKAILTIADITYSNKFGTHVGYSIYMGKPHVINPNSDNVGNEWHAELTQKTHADLNKDEEKFNKLFTGEKPWEITKEQKELVDYHFGLSYVKTKEEMYKVIEDCKAHFNKHFK